MRSEDMHLIENAIHAARLNYDGVSGLDWSMAQAVVRTLTNAGYRLHRDHLYKRIKAIGGDYEECERCGQLRPGLADNSSCPKYP
jgi:hypothetical protein